MTQKTNMTAVDFIKEQLSKNEDIRWRGSDIDSIYKQAKQMEKEQIVKAWDDGDYAYFYSKETGKDFDNGEQYYNETYGK